MEVFTGNNTSRYVTNFYVSPTMADTPYGVNNSTHGKARYESLRDVLLEHNYKLTPAQAISLLQKVAQGPENPELSTGFTQWSDVYNLNKKTVTMSILREWDKTFTFKVK